jgi:hypothetical protein
MATAPIQRAATARVEQIAGLRAPRDQVPGLRGFVRKGAEPLHHTSGRIHQPFPAPQGKLAPAGTNNFHNHA